MVNRENINRNPENVKWIYDEVFTKVKTLFFKFIGEEKFASISKKRFIKHRYSKRKWGKYYYLSVEFNGELIHLLDFSNKTIVESEHTKDLVLYSEFNLATDFHYLSKVNGFLSIYPLPLRYKDWILFYPKENEWWDYTIYRFDYFIKNLYEDLIHGKLKDFRNREDDFTFTFGDIKRLPRQNIFWRRKTVFRKVVLDRDSIKNFVGNSIENGRKRNIGD